MNINKLKLLLSAAVCIANACNVYAISEENVTTALQENFQQGADNVKLPPAETLTTSNNLNFKPAEIDISDDLSDDLNESFYIPPSVDVLDQPMAEISQKTTQEYQLPANPNQQLRTLLERSISRELRIDWRPGHTYRQTVSTLLATYGQAY